MNRPMMLKEMASGTFDLLVIGGGITGAGVAREASLRGLRVALVEQNDFAFGTSSRSTKLIHGGLRYLKQFDFKLVREAVEERQLLLEMAPHLVKATPFVFPVYRGDEDGLLKLRAGLVFYDLFARMRAAVPHRIYKPAGLLEQEPGLRTDGLTGGAVYTDGRTNDGRLTLAVIQSAIDHGAVVANYANVTSFLYAPEGRLAGVCVEDTITGHSFEVKAARILAAAGPWADAIRRLDDPDAKPLLRLTKGVHLTVPHERLPLQNAVVMRGRDQRMMFAVPSGDYSYIGTTDTDHHGPATTARVEREDVTYILDAANRSFPAARLDENDVVSAWVGVRPLIQPEGNVNPSGVSRDYALFHSPSGLVTVGGGKLTAFRAMASKIVDGLFPSTVSRVHLTLSTAPLPGSGSQPDPSECQALATRTNAPLASVQQWGEAYGSNLGRVTEYLPELPSANPQLAWFQAMTRYAVQHEMAQRLEDVYCRRTNLLLMSDGNGRQHLEPLAAEMAALLGWSPDRTRDEIDRCRSLIQQMFMWR